MLTAVGSLTQAASGTAISLRIIFLFKEYFRLSINPAVWLMMTEECAFLVTQLSGFLDQGSFPNSYMIG